MFQEEPVGIAGGDALEGLEGWRCVKDAISYPVFTCLCVFNPVFKVPL